MKLFLTCKCGDSIELQDSANKLLDTPDEEGRIYKIEKIADRWWKKHEKCNNTVGQLLMNGTVISKK
jgi:hypothetical protein